MNTLRELQEANNHVKNINASLDDLKSNLQSMHESALKIIDICREYKEQSR